MLTGIDISHYDKVNFATLKTNFIYMKASEGTSIVDNLFPVQWSEVLATGIPRGAYHFYRAAKDPIAQANFFFRVVKALAPSDLPPAIDLEVPDGAPLTEIGPAALKFLRTIQVLFGRTPIVYGPPSFLGSLDLTSDWAQFPLWVANYEVETPAIPKPWTKWSIWQWTDEAGPTPGISTPYDANYLNGDSLSILG